MSEQPKEPTKAQREMLEYMIKMGDRTGGPGGWRGGSFIDYYMAKHPAANQEKWATGGRQHGFRRAGGTALMNLEKAGWVRRTGSSWGVPEYDLIRDVAYWLAHYAIESGQRRSHPLGAITVVREHGNGRWWVTGESRDRQILWTKSQILGCKLLAGDT